MTQEIVGLMTLERLSKCAAFIDDARANGAVTCSITVHGSDKAAFEAIGWKPSGVRSDYFGLGKSAIEMTLKLNTAQGADRPTENRQLTAGEMRSCAS